MNLLVSYAHIMKCKRWIPLLELWASKGLPVIIDSGAYSAAKSGINIDHNAYMMFVKQIQSCGKQTEFVQLDELRNPVATRNNLMIEYSAGLKSVPVLTNNATLDEFAELVEHFNTRVCIAGATVMEPEQINRKMERCWKRVNGNTKIHALGYSNGWGPFRSVAYSYDSTSWLAALKWGNAHFYDPIYGIKTTHYKEVATPSLASLPKEMRNVLMASGITEQELRGKHGGRTQTSIISFVSTDAWLRWAIRVEHNNQKFYFAAVIPWMLCQLLLAAIHHNRNGINWPQLKTEISPLMETLSKGDVNVRVVEGYLDRAIASWRTMI
jgi:hypothetical protein